MNNLAELTTPPQTKPNPAKTAAWTAMLRAAILTIPEADRSAVFNELRDLLPPSMLKQPLAPRRGGELLNNVFRLFKSDPTTGRTVADVVEALSKEKPVEPQPVRLALNYLNSRRILRRVGYGKYQLEDGSIVDGIP